MSAPARAADTTVDERPPEERLEDHRRELTGYCYRMLGSAFEAEDAVQDTLLTLHTLRHTFDPTRPFGPWLATIAARRAIDRLRRRGRTAGLWCTTGTTRHRGQLSKTQAVQWQGIHVEEGG